eukprot:gene4402-4658_t
MWARVVLASISSVLLGAGALADAPSGKWAHGWATSADMTFADFNSPKLLTDAQVKFVSSKYRVVSLEKCTGVASGVTTE